MKSKITLELDFEDKEPFISILQVDSDDVRDKLVKHFLDCLGFEREVVFKIEVYQPFDKDKPRQHILKIKK